MKVQALRDQRRVRCTFHRGRRSYGYIFLLEDNAKYTIHTLGRDMALTSRGSPRMPRSCRSKTPAQWLSRPTYNTQEGAQTGLQNLIITNVPPQFLVVHEDIDSVLNEVEPRTLMATIEARVASVTVADAKTFKAARDKRLTFDTEEPLATQFTLIKKTITAIQRTHGVATSKTELMMSGT